jgi:hypothetical protein
LLLALSFRPTRELARAWLCAGLVFVTAMAAAASESPRRAFTADVVSRDSHGATPRTIAHLFAAPGKVRIEPGDMPDDFLLIDQEASSTLLVRPQRELFMNARQSSPLTQVFVPIGMADPCKQWRVAVVDALDGKGVEHWRCEKLQALAFRTFSADGPLDERLLDARLQFPVKLISADGSSLTLENIQFTSLQASLFTVPRDYRRFDPRAVVERIKQSDVWAAPPTQ